MEKDGSKQDYLVYAAKEKAEASKFSEVEKGNENIFLH